MKLVMLYCQILHNEIGTSYSFTMKLSVFHLTLVLLGLTDLVFLVKRSVF